MFRARRVPTSHRARGVHRGRRPSGAILRGVPVVPDGVSVILELVLVQSAAGLVRPSLVGVWYEATGLRRALFVLRAVFRRSQRRSV